MKYLFSLLLVCLSLIAQGQIIKLNSSGGGEAIVVSAGDSAAHCYPGTISLVGTATGSPDSIRWFGGDGIFADDNDLTTTYTTGSTDSTAGSVTFNLAGYYQFGNVYDTVWSMITDSLLFTPTVNAGIDTTIFPGSDVYTGLAASNGNTFSWSASKAGSFDNNTLLHTTFTPTGTDNFNMILSAVNICGTSRDTTAVTIAVIDAGADYYFSNLGDDGNTGTSSLQSWESIDKLNAEIALGTFEGKIVALNAGDEFTGQIIIDSQNDITFIKYGEGANPEITGMESISGAWTDLGSNVWSKIVLTMGDVRLFSINDVFVPFAIWPNDGSWREYSGGSNLTFTDAVGLGTADNYWQGAEAVVGTSQYGYIIERFEVESLISDVFTVQDRFYNIYNGADHFYYLQNHINALSAQNEWVYNEDNHTFYIYSTSNPGLMSIEACNVDTLVVINDALDIEFNNITFNGANDLNIFINSSSEIAFDSCDIKNGSFDGLYFLSSDEIQLTYCDVSYIGNNGITNKYTDTVLIANNVINNIGTDRGAGGIGGAQSVGVTIASGDSISIIHNEIYDIGYNGITLIQRNSGAADSTTRCYIDSNYIHDYLLTKADGGGIYTWQYTSNNDFGNKVRNNIVVDGEEGVLLGMIDDGTEGETYPLYFDDRSDNIEVLGNTCGDGNYGIYLHSNYLMNVHHNNVYSGRYSTYALIDANATIEMSYINTHDNVFVMKPATLNSIYFNHMVGEIAGGNTTFTNNYFINPFDAITSRVAYGYDSSPIDEYDWTEWTALTIESGSKRAPVIISAYPLIEQDDFVKFVYNPTLSDSTYTVLGTFVDIDGNEVVGDTIIHPFSSAIFFKIADE